jgi:hypothetical protein
VLLPCLAYAVAMSIYIRCLRCYSAVNIAGRSVPSDSEVITCGACKASFTYGELVAGTIERIRQGENPDPRPLQ